MELDNNVIVHLDRVVQRIHGAMQSNQNVIDDDSDSIETIYDESQSYIKDNSDYGDMPSLIGDASQNSTPNMIVPDSVDGNDASKYSESPEFLSDPVTPNNIRRDL